MFIVPNSKEVKTDAKLTNTPKQGMRYKFSSSLLELSSLRSSNFIKVLPIKESHFSLTFDISFLRDQSNKEISALPDTWMVKSLTSLS